MKSTTLDDISKIVINIQDNNFSRIEIRSFLIMLRDITTPVIRDLANFVAHENERDSGILRKDIKNFVDDFMKFAESGGQISIPGPKFTQEQIIDQICETLRSLKILGFDEILFKSRSFEIMSFVLQIIADTKIITGNKKINNCYFSPMKESERGLEVYFCFEPINSNKNIIKAKTIDILALFAHKL